MRKFMKSHDSLKDSRIAYTYLIILALVLAVMGLVVTQLRNQLGINELIGYRETLAECSDSLRGFAGSSQSDRKLAAALRFENAAASLVCGDDARTELLNLAGVLRKSALGEAPIPDETVIRALSDMFSILASLEYKNGDAAREHISDILSHDFVSAVIGNRSETENGMNIADSDLTPPVSGKLEQYAYTKATGSAERLLGSTVKLLILERADSGYTARADNLRAVFSKSDGRAETLLHIRLGTVPEAFYSESDLADYAKSLVVGTLGIDEGALAINRLETFCGFTTAEFVTTSERIVLVLDSHGRLWALEKAKR